MPKTQKAPATKVPSHINWALMQLPREPDLVLQSQIRALWLQDTQLQSCVGHTVGCGLISPLVQLAHWITGYRKWAN